MNINSDTHDMDQSARYALLEAELDTLFQVSKVLSRSLDLPSTLTEVLTLLHEFGRLRYAMVCLLDEEVGDLPVTALHGFKAETVASVRYQPGEGMIGTIFEESQAVVVPRIADEPRFLDRLGLYERELPFIGVPITHGEQGTIGVFAAQPIIGGRDLPERARFLEMVANLIGQSVHLSRSIEQEQRALRDERDRLRRTVKGNHGFDSIVGHTPPMQTVFEQVRQVAKWNTTVLIRGESGTGKEMIASAIHYNSPRANGTFIKLNCAALPDNLLESELFGHEKGAFTGAISQRKGRFEQADGGSLFLDEIGEISGAFQAKLLRVLQEGEFERVGGNKTLKVDTRIITATNKDLEYEVERGNFREDLYYRLNVMPIRVPALRDRSEDIPDLACFLVDKIARQQGRVLVITDSALRMLLRHSWPGNVRELENTLERAAIMSHEGNIDRDAIVSAGLKDHPVSFQPVLERGTKIDLNNPELDERERVIAALEEAGWVQAKAARLLDMTPRQIAYRIQTLNINVRQM